MNNIMEYQKVLANYTNINMKLFTNIHGDETSRNILDELDTNKAVNQEENHVLYTMDDGIQLEHALSERMDNLFHKLHRVEQIDANGCIMIKPPKLRRSYNIYNINNRQYNMNTIEEKAMNLEINMRILEETMNIEERISLYENRLNKLEEFILCKNEKYLYNEN